MAEIWLASAAALMALGCLVSLVIGAIRDREIKDMFIFLENENNKLRLQNVEILHKVNVTNANVQSVERKIRK